MIELIVPQGSSEWHDARLGRPTASMFKCIVTPGGKPTTGDARQKYLEELAAERVTGVPTARYVSWEMKEAAETEDDSCRVYAMDHHCIARKTGLCYKNEDRLFSCSPDRLIDPSGGFETKGTIHARLQFQRADKGTMMREHIPQVQGCLYVTEREWWDFQSYHPDDNVPELCVRVHRDEAYIKLLHDELERFCSDLEKQAVKFAGIVRRVKEG